MWRPEPALGGIPQVLSILLLRRPPKGSRPGLALAEWVGQPVSPRDSPVVPPQCWSYKLGTQWRFLCGFCGLNSGLPVCKAAILPTELFPGPHRTLTMLTCTVVCGYVSVENWGAEEGG